MRKIKVLGTGCPKCKILTANAEKALSILGEDFAVEKVEDIGDIIALGVMATPGLALDDKVLSSGRVLSAEEIVSLINNNSFDKRSCNCKDCC